jgi:hypothetical protein
MITLSRNWNKNGDLALSIHMHYFTGASVKACGSSGSRWEENIKLYHQKVRSEDGDWTELAQDRVQ